LWPWALRKRFLKTPPATPESFCAKSLNDANSGI
jgi:hypothetical protein